MPNANDKKPITTEEMDRLHDEIDYQDRQDTIESIYELASKIKKHDSSDRMFETLKEIEFMCDEFLI